MDGGRRLLGSMSGWASQRASDATHASPDDLASVRRFPLGFGRGGFRIGARVIQIRRGMGTLATFAFLGIAGTAGWYLGGHYDSMQQAHGRIRDIAARVVGFPIRVVDVTGVKELTKAEVLSASGLTPSGSLVFVDANEARAKVKAMPLVADATVRKLYPDRILITVTERDAYALWQHEGQVRVVSADGTVIDTLRDQRYLKLPHVVGPGAALRVKEYVELLAQVPELKDQIRAGILVSERRWTIKLNSGIDVKLPEAGAVEALRQLISLDKQAQVLSKDVIDVDLRIPGRVAFRLTEEAAAARRDDFEKRLPKVKGRA
jgi:cell division protein FtsQ